MLKRLAMWSFIGFTCCLALSCQKPQAPEVVQLKQVQPKAEFFALEGVTAPSDSSKNGDYLKALQAKKQEWQAKKGIRAAVGGGAVPYFDLIFYSYIACQANWDQSCSGDYDFTAPPGYQVCKALYSVTSTNGSQSFSFSAAHWFTGDAQKPPRFTVYHFNIWAKGSGLPWNQTGANITVSNVGIRVIAADVDNVGRYETGCDLPTP